MKKLLALCLTAVLCLCCLASCELIHTALKVGEHSCEYIVYEAGHHKVYVCGCPTPDIIEEHYDHDGNWNCDACGYDMLIGGAHEFEYVASEEGHCEHMVGEACDGTCNKSPHEDLDGDLFCDICGYNIYPLIPPEENHFIRNQAGAEWLCEITAEDIAEIKMISGGGGPLPPVSFTHISSSRSDAVISSILEEYYWLDSKPVSEERTQIADGGYFIVQFILNNGETKQLYFINGDFYHDGNGNYFELVRLPVFRDGTNFVTRYGFERQYDPYQIYLIDETPICEIPFSEFEFAELTDDICLDAELPTHYFELNGVRVYFIKGEYFYIGDSRSAYYQLIGNLDELIAKYSVIDE